MLGPGEGGVVQMLLHSDFWHTPEVLHQLPGVGDCSRFEAEAVSASPGKGQKQQP